MIHDYFDPGNVTGVARFDCGRLVYADALRFEALIRMPSMRPSNKTVIELPQSYRLEHQKGDQNDLIRLAYQAGRLEERHGAVGNTVLVLPRQWKGQRPKKVTRARAELVLDPYELTLIRSDDHNLWDAVAIGLRDLGRVT
jgi:hypothetical protein